MKKADTLRLDRPAIPMERVAATMEHERHAPERLSLRRLSPALGAEVTRFELESPGLGRLLDRALLDHQLVLMRGLDLDPGRFRRIARCLGRLRRVPYGMQQDPGMPDVQRLSNLRADGAPSGTNPDPYALNWHTDGSAVRIPARYTLFYAVRIPDRGGETSFANMYAACSALSPARRQALVGRRAIHDPDLARHFRYGSPITPAATSLTRSFRMRVRFVGRMVSPKTVRHPMIRVHEDTGRSCLFLGDHAWRVTGCGWRPGARLVNELNTFATTHPEWTYTHSWRVGDLVIWDNRCLLHRGSEYDTARQERVMLRAVVDGVSVPIAARA